MGSLGETLLVVLGGSGDRFLLLASLIAAFLIDRNTRCESDSSSARFARLGASAFLASLFLWGVADVVALSNDLPAYLWAAPFDRLLGVAVLVMLGWAILSPGETGPRWHLFLAVGFACTAVVFWSWTPVWARELVDRPLLTDDPTGRLWMWDVWQLALAAAVGYMVMRRSADAPRWLLGVIVVLAAGSFLELASPLTATIPVWSRLCNFAAGFFFAAMSVKEAGYLPATGIGPPWLADRLPAGARGAAGAPQTQSGGDAQPHEPVPDLDFEVDRDVVATQSLRQMVDGLGAEPALACLVTPSGDVDVWALAGRQSPARRLGTLPLSDRPTLVRALRNRGLRLASSRLARDVDQLFGLLGISSNGPVLMEPIGHPVTIGLLIAGKPTDDWSEDERIALQAIARHAAAALEAIEANEAARGDLARAFSALETQAAAISRLNGTVDDLAARVGRMESPGAEPPAEAASPEIPPAIGADGVPADDAATFGPTSRTEVLFAPDHDEAPIPADEVATDGPSEPPTAPGGEPGSAPLPTQAPASPDEERMPEGVLERIARYERALERLPWGVIVADAEGNIVFGNDAAAHLLHTDRVRPGQPIVALFPDEERLGYAFHRLHNTAGSDQGPLEVLFDSPRLRVELEPLHDAVVGYLGAVAVLHHRAAESGSVAGQLLPALADALRAPMKSILGYSDLLAQSGGLTEDQVGRFLHRIDANLARMQVSLGNLLTSLELDNERTAARPEEVDIVQALQEGVVRGQAQFDEKALDVTYAMRSPLPPASADPDALEQIIDNLLANAAQRSPQGGDVIVGAEVRDDVGDTRGIVIYVHDRGAQLPGAAHGMIEIDEGEGGSGSVGLTIVRLLAEQQGGRAWAESDPLGARFHVRLPVRRGA